MRILMKETLYHGTSLMKNVRQHYLKFVIVIEQLERIARISNTTQFVDKIRITFIDIEHRILHHIRTADIRHNSFGNFSKNEEKG